MNNEMESDRIRTALKEVMRNKKLRYGEAAQCLSLSLPRFKSLMSRGNLSLERIMKICDYADISFYDLIDFTRSKLSETQRYFNDEQENYFVRYPSVGRFYVELMNGRQPDQIARSFKLTEKSKKRYLGAMASMDLIQTQGGRVKLKFGIPLGPRPGGVLFEYLSRSYSKTIPLLVESEIISSHNRKPVGNKSESFKCSGLNLSYKSRLQLKQDLDELWDRYVLIEHIEYNIDKDQDVKPTTLMTLFKEHGLFASAFAEIRNI